MGARARRIAIVGLVALLLRAAALATPLNSDRLFGDETEYATYARNLATRGVYEAPWVAGPPMKAHRPPVFPAYLALHHRVAGEERFVAAAKLTNVLVGSCIPLLVFLGVELLIGSDTRRKQRAAFACGLFAAAYPYLILFGLMVMSELLFTALALLASLLLLRVAKRPSPGALALTGVVAGLATLARPGYLLFPALAAALLFFRAGWPGSAKRRLALAGVLLAAYAATLAPWLLRNQRELGAFPVLASNGAEPFWIGNHPDSEGNLVAPVRTPAERREWDFAVSAPDELERDRRFRQLALGHIAGDPLRYLGLAFVKAAHLWDVEIGYLRFLRRVRRVDPMPAPAVVFAELLLSVPFAVLTLAFFAALCFAPHPPGLHQLTGFVAYSTLVCMVVFGDSRFHLPFVPQMIVCAAPLFLVRREDLTRRGRLLAFSAAALVWALAVGALPGR